ELHAAARYLFGNWGGSGEGEAGSATIEITADKDSTWFQANFVEQPWDGIRHASPWVERPPCRTEERECWMRNWYRNSVPHYDNEFGAWPHAFVFVSSAGETPGVQNFWLTNLSDGQASFSVRASGGIELRGTTTTDDVEPVWSAVGQEEISLESHQTARVVLNPPTGFAEGMVAGEVKVCRSLWLRPDPCISIPTTYVVTSTSDTVQPDDDTTAWPDEFTSFDAGILAESATDLAEEATQDTNSSRGNNYRESYNRLVREARSSFPGIDAVQALEEIGPSRYDYTSKTVALEARGFARFMRTGVASAIYSAAATELAELAGQDTNSSRGNNYRATYNRLVREARRALPDLHAVQALEEIGASRYDYTSKTVALEARGFARFMRTGVASDLYSTAATELAELAGQDTNSSRGNNYRETYNRLVREARRALPDLHVVQALEEIGASRYDYTSKTVALEARGFARFMRTRFSANLFATAASDLTALAGQDTNSSRGNNYRETYNRLVREAKRVFAGDSPIQSLKAITGSRHSYSSDTVSRSASRLRAFVEREPTRVAAVKRSWSERAGERFDDCSDCPEMVIVPDGGFWMGSPSEEPGRADNEGPVHRVEIQVPFAIGVHEVTRSEYDAFVQDSGHASGSCEMWNENLRYWEPIAGRSWRNPGFPQEDDHPAVCVSSDDAQEYVGWLTKKTGQRYRLPSEAEWEYAARAGTTAAYYFGESISTSEANFDGRGAGGTYLGRTSPVGSYPENQFGLRSVHGNVWEMTADCWNEDYVGAPVGGGVWTTGECRTRVRRGGGWKSTPEYIRSASRSWVGWKGNGATARTATVGFRVARTLGPGGER
ncbi:MAG: formylglycine-generating enzyme family protein, partial [Bryobacterales bacterium]|nr:formylglycine-generating enzyme family protein [Bryobacterales bacterium]